MPGSHSISYTQDYAAVIILYMFKECKFIWENPIFNLTPILPADLQERSSIESIT
jgi:hypothetical protein